MLTGNFYDLHAAGCIQTGADVESDQDVALVRFGPMLRVLMIATSNDPCNGCPAYHGGKCPAFKRFNTRAAPMPAACEPRGPSKPFVKPIARCPQCKLKIGGPNHKEGWDHLHRVGAVK